MMWQRLFLHVTPRADVWALVMSYVRLWYRVLQVANHLKCVFLSKILIILAHDHKF